MSRTTTTTKSRLKQNGRTPTNEVKRRMRERRRSRIARKSRRVNRKARA